MLELFKPQGVTEDFVVSEHVFSSESLPPVCLSELSSKEEELLSGSVNSNTSKRFVHQQNVQQQQQQMQQHTRQQSPSQYYSRSSGAHRSNSSSMLSGARSRIKDSPARDRDAINGSGEVDYNDAGDAFGALGGLDNDDDDGSLWATQSIVRNSVGSFGADGVFRMGGSDDGDPLEGPSLRESARSLARKGNSTFSSRAASPRAGLSRGGAGGGGSVSSASMEHDFKSPRGEHSSVVDDGWSWRDPAGRQPSSVQQRGLLEQAEKVRWWYRDPQGSIQGPFSASHMQEWYTGGYFPPELQVCYEGGPGLEPLGGMVARIGNADKVFICTALASIAHQRQALSGISTPATPGAISRSGSTVHLMASSGDESAPAAAPAQDALTEPLQVLADLVDGGNGQAATSKPAWSSHAASSVESPASDTRPLVPGRDSPNSTAPATTGAAAAADSAQSQAMQLAVLLNEQYVLVAAIRDRQQAALKLQEDLQQSIAKLMQDLAQESNGLHYKAQLANVPVQPELLFALQQQAHATEERLRHEYAQCVQNHATQIAQLETKLDPVIKDIVFRSGPAYALEFIRQQLQKLSLQMATEGQQQQNQAQEHAPAQVRAQDATEAAALATISPSEPAAAAEAVATAAIGTPPASAAEPASEVAAVEERLQQVSLKEESTDLAPSGTADVAGKQEPSAAAPKALPSTTPKTKPRTTSTRAVENNAVTSSSATDATAAGAGASASEGTGSSAEKQAKSAKDQPSSACTEPESAGNNTSDAAERSEARNAGPSTVQLPGASPAPWSTGTTARGNTPKKTLLQIQQEEEEATKKRQQAEGHQRAKTLASRGFGTSYADRLGSSGGGSTGGGLAGPVAPRSLASIMEEQSKESASTGAATVATASTRASINAVNAQQPLSPASVWGNAAAAAAAATGAKGNGGKSPHDMSAAKVVSSNLGPALPSMEFLEWCYTRLSSLRGIDTCKFIEMLLTFPLHTPESTLEIIAEQVYAHSDTLNGRAFAEDFAKRRRGDHTSVKHGKLRSAPANWAQVLGSSRSAVSAKGPSSSRSGYGDAGAFSTVSKGSGADSTSFQVVGKKGRK
ncbi:hypothetical protein GQ54DRAFT_298254 [Martensiomyces pterosporus]|nr:hypothetical protein GQ54DRAFT_298254 [Martensiomyces pterosporus]